MTKQVLCLVVPSIESLVLLLLLLAMGNELLLVLSEKRAHVLVLVVATIPVFVVGPL